MTLVRSRDPDGDLEFIAAAIARDEAELAALRERVELLERCLDQRRRLVAFGRRLRAATRRRT